jgi:hypothetical protein
MASREQEDLEHDVWEDLSEHARSWRDMRPDPGRVGYPLDCWPTVMNVVASGR